MCTSKIRNGKLKHIIQVIPREKEEEKQAHLIKIVASNLSATSKYEEGLI